MPSGFLIREMNLLGVLGVKRIVDFSKLIISPYFSQKEDRMSLNFQWTCGMALKKNRASSAKNK